MSGLFVYAAHRIILYLIYWGTSKLSTCAGTVEIDGRIKLTIYVIRNMLPDKNFCQQYPNPNDDYNYSHRYYLHNIKRKILEFHLHNFNFAINIHNY